MTIGAILISRLHKPDDALHTECLLAVAVRAVPVQQREEIVDIHLAGPVIQSDRHTLFSSHAPGASAVSA